MNHITKCLMCGWKSEPGEIAHRCGGCGYSSGKQAGALLAFPAEGLEGLTKERCLRLAAMDEGSDIGAVSPEMLDALSGSVDTTPPPLKSNELGGNGVGFITTVQTPVHYQSHTGITPWDLQRGMKSSGNAFVDGRRCDAIKYAFRVKQNMAEDLRKAAHCLMEAVAELDWEQKKPETACIYNDWPFWKAAGVIDGAWRAESKGVRLYGDTKDALFDAIDRANARRKETAEKP